MTISDQIAAELLDPNIPADIAIRISHLIGQYGSERFQAGMQAAGQIQQFAAIPTEPVIRDTPYTVIAIAGTSNTLVNGSNL